MKNNILFLIFLFLISCDFNDTPVSVDDINQDELNYKQFDLNLELSDTIQKLPSVGESLLMYSGPIYDGTDMYSIFSFDNEIFSNYDLCVDDTISYNNLYLVLDLVNDYSLNQTENNNQPPNGDVDAPSISAYWVDYSDIINSDGENLIDQDWLESDTYLFNDININFSQLNSDSSKRLFVENILGKYYIDLTNQLISDSQNDNDCFSYNQNECDSSDLCFWTNSECLALINYINICDFEYDLDKLLLIVSNSNITHEFASSNYISDYSNTEPYLNILYNDFEESTKKSNKFILNTTIPDYATTNYYVSDTLLNNYNYIFISNLFDQQTIEELDDSLIWSDYIFDTPLINNNSLNIEHHLLDIDIDLINIDNYSSSGISFWLDNIKYLKYSDDPNNDNWNSEDSTGTEGNNIWDTGEYIEDYGLDLCSSYFEDGLGGCVADSTMSAYNIEGTEGNNIWDNGENYSDYGVDSCPDIYEDGIGGCLCSLLENCDEEAVCEDEDLDGLCDNGLDPNLDNYNNDPSQDDWFDTNNNQEWDEGEGLEGNNQRDDGEPFSDVGLDGLLESLVGYSDEGENDNIYNFGEPYFDTGPDSLFSINEINYNIIGKQNDKLYQFGEPFDDCGIDSECNDNDISDNYNIDPNNDNWNDCGSDGLCPNDDSYIEPDQDGSELNGLWDENEGTELNGLHDSGSDIEEYFEDYGLDNIQNSNELVLDNQKIAVSMTDTIFFDYINNSYNLIDFSSQENDSLKVWISSVEKNSDSTMKISISSLSEHQILGLEFKLKHDIYTTQVMDWNSKERNVAKVDFDSYIKDFSIFDNSNPVLPDSSSLFMNYAYGISTLLNFDSLGYFIENNRDIVINENNSKLKLFFNKNDPNFILESNNYMIDVNKIDSTEISTLFSYFVQNNPDSLVIPIGNLMQEYIDNEHNYGDGFLIGLNPNQYPAIYNFNNIILDTSKSPIIEIYYFK